MGFVFMPNVPWLALIAIVHNTMWPSLVHLWLYCVYGNYDWYHPICFRHATDLRSGLNCLDVGLDLSYQTVLYSTVLLQTWYLTATGELRSGLNCLGVGLDPSYQTVYSTVLLQTWYLTAMGELRSGVNCLDVGLDPSYQTVLYSMVLLQTWYLTATGELRSGVNCLDVGLDLSYQTVKMDKCHGQQGNQLWMYTQVCSPGS